jgi:steroid delta-isomerase-like uncharacterized protein
MGGADLAQRIIDAINQKDSGAVGVLYAADAVDHDPQYPEPLRGRADIQQSWDDVFRAFPDARATLQSTLEGNGAVAFEMVVEGTNDGPIASPLGEFPPTGRFVHMDVAIFARMNDAGEIVEERDYYDVGGIRAQLGIE